MSKNNFFVKYLKNINISINSLLEKNLNKLNFQNFKNLRRNNKLILTFVAVLVLFTSYLLLPAFYKDADISKELKLELKNKLGIDFTFSEKLNYTLFPRPHFTTTNSLIIRENREISEIKKLKIYISLENFFSLNNIEIYDVVIENANFNLNKKNYNLFIELLDNIFLNSSFKIKKSNVFFTSANGEVLFINKILDMKYYYDQREQKNILYAENEIFKIPYSIELFNDKNKKKIFSKFNFNFLKTKIENEIAYENEMKFGILNLISNKTKSKAIYKFNRNFFEFEFFDKLENSKFSYNGKFNFNPFYSDLSGRTEKLNLSYFIDPNSFLLQLLKTEIFYNKNINFKLDINAKTFGENTNFSNIDLNSKIQEGLIDLDDTKFKWRNFVDFKLADTLIIFSKGEMILDGKLNVNVSETNEIYKYLLTPKDLRKKFNKIELNFSYNFDQKTINLSDIKIDNKYNQNINNIIGDLIFKKNNLQNRIYLKNVLNDLIKSYEG